MATKKKTSGITGTVKQTFAIQAPGASSVLLAGDFTQWGSAPISLKRHEDGIWRTQVDLLPGEHRYRFIVDGEWREDPDCMVRVANPYGSHDSIVDVNKTKT